MDAPAEPKPTRLQAFLRAGFKPVSGASLAVFRMVFGAIMLFEVFVYFRNDWIAYHYRDPTYHFTYEGFSWVQPWPGQGMALHFVGLGILSVLIGLGLFYRVAAFLFFFGWTYVFLLEEANYLNHFYLIVLLSFLLIFLPANQRWSLDARRRGLDGTVPAWSVWLVQCQLGLVYFWGGVAKLFSADWLQGEPMRMWMAKHHDMTLVGPLMTQDWFIYFMSYSGMVFDLAIFPLLMWRRTRIIACVFLISFHLMNSQLFHIGIFPWFMLGATVMFLEPDTPAGLLRWLKKKAGFVEGDTPKEKKKDKKGKKPKKSKEQRHAKPEPTPAEEVAPLTKAQRWTAGLAVAWLTVQMLLPLRPFLYPGNPNWTEEGHRFSWHMKLRQKTLTELGFLIVDPETKEQKFVSPKPYLTERQLKKMATRPNMILQFSHYLVKRLEADWKKERLEVYVICKNRLNGREPQDLIDPTVDLAQEDWSFFPSPWIVPLTTPLPER